MEIYIHDKQFQQVDVIDEFISLIWTERYCGYGDFELYLACQSSAARKIKAGQYLTINGSRSWMIVTKIQTEVDFEDGDKMIVTGQSFESVLDRRVILNDYNFEQERVATILEKLVDESFITTEDSRKVEGFYIQNCSDEAMLEEKTDLKTNHESLYEVVNTQCEKLKWGFKLDIYDDGICFQLVKGTDRSAEQSENLPVIFASEKDNLINSTYSMDISSSKNVSIVFGKDEAGRVSVVVGEETGLERKELYFVDDKISSADANAQELLTDSAKTELSKKLVKEEIDGRIDTKATYFYGTDYFIGDIVTIEDVYGNRGSARIVEMILSITDDGMEVYPKFVMLDDE